MSIRSKIQSLITAANAKTGESDTTLTDAVQTLVDGYGQGGGESFSTNVSVQQGVAISASKKAMDVNIPVGASIYALVTDTGGVLTIPFGGVYFWNEDGTKDRQLSVTAEKAVGWIAEKRITAVSLYATAAQTVGTGTVTLDIVII